MGHKSTEEIRDLIDQHKMEMGRAGFARKSCLAQRIEDLEWVIADRTVDGVPKVVVVDGEVQEGRKQDI